MSWLLYFECIFVLTDVTLFICILVLYFNPLKLNGISQFYYDLLDWHKGCRVVFFRFYSNLNRILYMLAYNGDTD